MRVGRDRLGWVESGVGPPGMGEVWSGPAGLGWVRKGPAGGRVEVRGAYPFGLIHS